ncbi:unnamed protein product [Leuciscus chuanchicus]
MGRRRGGEVLLLTERAHPGSAGDHRGQSGSPCPTWPHVVWEKERERASEMCLIFSHLSPPRETQGAPIYNEYLESRRDHRREPQLEQQETPGEVNSGKDRTLVSGLRRSDRRSAVPQGLHDPHGCQKRTADVLGSALCNKVKKVYSFGNFIWFQGVNFAGVLQTFAVRLHAVGHLTYFQGAEATQTQRLLGIRRAVCNPPSATVIQLPSSILPWFKMKHPSCHRLFKGQEKSKGARQIKSKELRRRRSALNLVPVRCRPPKKEEKKKTQTRPMGLIKMLALSARKWTGQLQVLSATFGQTTATRSTEPLFLLIATHF